MKTVHAIYDQGVFRPTEHVNLPEPSEVEFEPRPVTSSGTETDERRRAREFAELAGSCPDFPDILPASWSDLPRDL